MKRVTAGLTAAAFALPLAALACPPEYPFAVADAGLHHLMAPRALSAVAPVAWALGMLALAVASVRERKRPGFGQVLFTPGFLAGAALATTGAFFLRWLPLGGILQHGLSLPLPDMDQLVFGPGSAANPIFYSALIPAVVSAAGVRFQGPRRLVAGIACGFGGTLAAAAWAGWPELSVLSSRWVSLPWLAANALACCFIARAMFVAEARNLSSPR